LKRLYLSSERVLQLRELQELDLESVMISRLVAGREARSGQKRDKDGGEDK
jgi:hypothetical protein